MAQSFHYGTARAYARKPELGGGYRGRLTLSTGGVTETDVHDTQDGAWRAINRIVFDQLRDRLWSWGHLRGNRYRKNIWIHPADAQLRAAARAANISAA